MSIVQDSISIPYRTTTTPNSQLSMKKNLNRLIEGPLKSSGFNSVMIVVDKLSKYLYFYMLKHSYTIIEIKKIY